jgi:hypothetical protein
MKEQLVRIHARLCGDGYASFYETTESDRDRRAIVVYTNLIDSNLEQFRSDMKEIFDVEMYRYGDEVKVKSIPIVESLQERFGSFSSDKWEISSEIQQLSKEKKLQWLRAFIRDEGHYEGKYNRLRVKSTNETGIRQVNKMMRSIGIDSNVTGPNCDESYYLNVSKIDQYDELYRIARNKPKVK